jgi:hypothetical protein
MRITKNGADRDMIPFLKKKNDKVYYNCYSHGRNLSRQSNFTPNMAGRLKFYFPSCPALDIPIIFN